MAKNYDNPKVTKKKSGGGTGKGRTIADIHGSPLKSAIGQTKNIYTDAIKKTAGIAKSVASQVNAGSSRSTTTTDAIAKARAQVIAKGTISKGSIQALNAAVGIGGTRTRKPAPKKKPAPSSSVPPSSKGGEEGGHVDPREGKPPGKPGGLYPSPGSGKGKKLTPMTPEAKKRMKKALMRRRGVKTSSTGPVWSDGWQSGK